MDVIHGLDTYASHYIITYYFNQSLCDDNLSQGMITVKFATVCLKNVYNLKCVNIDK